MELSKDDGCLYDVVGVNIETNEVRVLENGKTKPNAEAIVAMAVMRRGLDENRGCMEGMIQNLSGTIMARWHGKNAAKLLVDLDGFEPSTSSMPWKRRPPSSAIIRHKSLTPLVAVSFPCGTELAHGVGTGAIAVLARTAIVAAESGVAG